MLYGIRVNFIAAFKQNIAAVIILLLCSGIWWSLSQWYNSYLADVQSTQTHSELNRYAQNLSTIIYKRLTLLHALASFVDTDIVNSKNFTALSQNRAETFISGLRSSNSGIRNFAIAPGGIINFVSPLAGNEKAIGHELLNDPQPGVKDVSLRAIEIREVAHSTPYELRQGGLGLVARKAIYDSTGFWGLVSMVLDVTPIIEDAGLMNKDANLNMALRDNKGNVFFGSPQTFEQAQVIKQVKMPDGYWELAALPVIGSAGVSKRVAFQAITAAFLILLCGVSFVWLPSKKQPAENSDSQQKLLTQLKQSPIATINSQSHPPGWSTPILTVTAIIAVVIGFYSFIKENDVATQKYSFTQVLNQVSQSIERKLDTDREYLLLIAEELSQGKLDAQSFQTRVSRYVNDHSGLINVTWADSDFVIRHTAPLKENRQVLGLKLSLPEPKRASRLAYNSHKPAYTKPFVVIQGKSAFELYVPIFKQGEFLGTLGGVYSIEQLMDGVITKAIDSRYQIEILNSSGEVFYQNSDSQTVSTLSKTVPIKPITDSLWLHVSNYQQAANQNTKSLMLLAIVLAAGIGLSMWLQYRESCKHWRISKALHESQQHFHAIAKASPTAVVIISQQTKRLLYANRQANELFSEPGNSIVGQDVHDLYMNPEDSRDFFSAVEQQTQLEGFEQFMKKACGEPFWASLSCRQVTHDQETALVTSISDLTERKRYENQLYQQANYDSLTGLPNRVLAFDRLEHALIRATREQHLVALLFIDLDLFKNVNDSLGHSAGDQLLIEIAKRLSNSVRESDTVARLGGDEFMIILPGQKDATGAKLIAEKITKACTVPLQLDGNEVFISTSIGITLFPDDGSDYEQLIQNADTAMYRSKEAGRNQFSFYTKEMNEQAQAQLRLETELRRALKRNEFTLNYQPLVDVDSGEVKGSEALLRWHNPELGQVCPADFIPHAESMGLIVDIGHWVLETACKHAKQWENNKGMPQYVAVNVSGYQLKNEKFVQSISQILTETGLPPTSLELEITEGVLLDDPEGNRKTLETLSAMGVRLAIDDFGTGYSSLSYLRRFPFDTLKIDFSFIRDIPKETEAANLVSAIISIARVLGLKTVAEGVENQEQLEYLITHGCDLAQGFHIAKPMPQETETHTVQATLEKQM